MELWVERDDRDGVSGRAGANWSTRRRNCIAVSGEPGDGDAVDLRDCGLFPLGVTNAKDGTFGSGVWGGD